MIADLTSKLENSEIFKDWKEKHPDSFLSHFFCQLSSEFKFKSSWEAGYYEPENDKIAIFIVDDKIEIKKEDRVFKKPGDKVEKLNMNQVKISFEDALDIFKNNYLKLFPKAMLGDGFIILQTIDSKTLWNFTFITKAIKFVNIKIDAGNKNIESHQEVELVQK